MRYTKTSHKPDTMVSFKNSYYFKWKNKGKPSLVKPYMGKIVLTGQPLSGNTNQCKCVKLLSIKTTAQLLVAIHSTAA